MTASAELRPISLSIAYKPCVECGCPHNGFVISPRTKKRVYMFVFWNTDEMFNYQKTGKCYECQHRKIT